LVDITTYLIAFPSATVLGDTLEDQWIDVMAVANVGVTPAGRHDVAGAAPSAFQQPSGNAKPITGKV